MISRGKNKALKKQVKSKENLGLFKSGLHKGTHYDHILCDEDALKGANFYCYNNDEEWERLKEWAIQDKSKVNFTSNGLKNMLRSEHIAYNIFYPMEKLRNNDPNLLNKLLSDILNCKVDKVIVIRVEHAGPVHKSKLLEDNTSFDAYIEFLSGDTKCGAGIEIKYTEGSYPYGRAEEINLNDESSLYWKTAKTSGIFNLNETNKKLLISKKLKQPWRNHLLGLKMIQIRLLDNFYSVHFYPRFNTYQKSITEEYKNILTDSFKECFVPITFEDFAEIASKNGINEFWLNYFKNRY